MRNSILMLGTAILLAGCQSRLADNLEASVVEVEKQIKNLELFPPEERVPGGRDGSAPYVLPPAPEGQKFTDVMGEAEAVIKERYPLCTTAIKSRHVLARSKVSIFGLSRSQKQVSVWVRKTVTGHWHPEVTVLLMVEDPNLRAGASDPSSASVPLARPIAGSPVWRAMQRLPVEEQKIYDAIYARLNG